MRYRRNADRNLRELERQARIGGFNDFLRYRAALARSGHQDQLKLKKGIFLISLSGGLEYVRSSGRVNTITVAFHGNKQSDEWRTFLQGPSRKSTVGRGYAQDTESILQYNIIVPPEMAEFIENLRVRLYWEAVDPNNERLDEDGNFRREFEQEWWRADNAGYQEHLYITLVKALEDFGYYQEHYFEDVYCDRDCGRLLGLNTPKRRMDMMCLYCWKDRMGLDDAWLEEQLERSGGHPAKQD